MIKAITSNKKLKSFVYRLMVPKNQARPRLWVSWFVNPFFHTKKASATINRNVRMDVLPNNSFVILENSTIEDFSVINNGVGDVYIGANSRVGMGNTIIGPVHIENDVILAQNVVLSGLNHSYNDPYTPIHLQPVRTKEIYIKSGTWIAANAVITAGVTIGKNCVVGASSVVTKDLPDYSVAIGNPARIIKQYNPQSETWEKF